MFSQEKSYLYLCNTENMNICKLLFTKEQPVIILAEQNMNIQNLK